VGGYDDEPNNVSVQRVRRSSARAVACSQWIVSWIVRAAFSAGNSRNWRVAAPTTGNAAAGNLRCGHVLEMTEQAPAHASTKLTAPDVGVLTSTMLALR